MTSQRMSKDQFIAALARVLDWDGLSATTVLQGDQRWDSLGQVDAMMLIQDEIGVPVSAEQLQTVGSVGALADLVLASRIE